MSAAIDYYEEKYCEWFDRWEKTSRWHWYKRAIAFGRWKFYLELMMDTIAIENREKLNA